MAPVAGFPVLFHQDAMMFIQFLSCGFGIVELDFCCSFSGRSLDGKGWDGCVGYVGWVSKGSEGPRCFCFPVVQDL